MLSSKQVIMSALLLGEITVEDLRDVSSAYQSYVKAKADCFNVGVIVAPISGVSKSEHEVFYTRPLEELFTPEERQKAMGGKNI